MYFGGVEGGATHSNLVICDAAGQVLGRATGPGTNHWTLGMEECTARVLAMLREAKDDARIPQEKPLDALGLTLSGCEQESSNAELAALVKVKDPNSAKEVFVASDTAGSLATAAPDGGMVLIAGTGSNGFLHTHDGKRYGCGGWGYILGDEGGARAVKSLRIARQLRISGRYKQQAGRNCPYAYWIALRAVKTVFDDVDGLKPAPHSTERVWETIREYFGADSRADLLPHTYKHFDKSFYAGLTVKLSSLAEAGDALCQHLFACAGAAIAAHAAALAARGGGPRRLRVVCVGSVWKSWRLLRPGALAELAARGVTTELELVRLRVSSALGAARLAARAVQHELPCDDAACCDVFYTYRPPPPGDGHWEANGLADGAVGCGCADGPSWR